jgi:hypothetical protein
MNGGIGTMDNIDKDTEIDRLRRRIAYLEATQNNCATNKELCYDCRVWLVMNDMLKTKHRVRRDGR